MRQKSIGGKGVLQSDKGAANFIAISISNQLIDTK